MRKFLLSIACLSFSLESYCWGFYAHRQINFFAVFLLPPAMIGFYKKNISYLQDHAVDPDKRRYAVQEEGPRHYLDIDHYGSYPYPDLPRKWEDACIKYGEDSLNAYGIGPWWIQTMLARLTRAFEDRKTASILRLSAEIGHYIADLHVPLHTSSNHNGQKTGQHGIHGFWESRLPELLAEKEWDFFIGKAVYLPDPGKYIWDRVLESALAADSVLRFERELSASFPADRKYAYEDRNGVIVRQYSGEYSRAYDRLLKGMTERRMRQSIYSVACFWYTAWVNAGQPPLHELIPGAPEEFDRQSLDSLSKLWSSGRRGCE